jgi:small subunit ribosomal protein S20
MPLRHKSAQKRARQTIKRTERNKKTKSLIKGSVKSVLSKKDKNSAEPELKKTVAIIDKAATKGVIHKNKAARTKSKISKHVNNLK